LPSPLILLYFLNYESFILNSANIIAAYQCAKAEAVLRLTKNYTADIEAFDQIEALANTMTDSYADGTVEQFPDKFKM